MDKPVKFWDVPRGWFPFTVRFYDPETMELLWEQEVVGAGALSTPGQGKPVRVVIELADGTTVEVGPNSER